MSTPAIYIERVHDTPIRYRVAVMAWVNRRRVEDGSWRYTAVYRYRG